MNKSDALSILNLNVGFVDAEVIKKAYRKAAFQYHPDRNPAGLEMMKLINLAYETLKDFEGEITQEEAHKNYGESVNQALNSIMTLGLTIELCGAWVWVSGNTKPHKDLLKSTGFLWSPKKSCWYFRPEGQKSFNRSSWSMEKIRATYGSEAIKNKSVSYLGQV